MAIDASNMKRSDIEKTVSGLDNNARVPKSLVRCKNGSSFTEIAYSKSALLVQPYHIYTKKAMFYSHIMYPLLIIIC